MKTPENYISTRNNAENPSIYLTENEEKEFENLKIENLGLRIKVQNNLVESFGDDNMYQQKYHRGRASLAKVNEQIETIIKRRR